MKNVTAITAFALCALMSAVTAAALPSPATVTSLGLEHGLSNSYVVSIAQDKRGIMWVATEDGLNIFDGGRFIPIYKSETSPEVGLSGNELNTLLDDPVDSVMWIGTQRAGINAFDYSDGSIRRIRHNPDDPSSLVTDDVTRIVALSTGKLLVATFWWGVDVFDPEKGVFEHFNHTNVAGMPMCNIWTVADSGDGDNIYIGHKTGFMELSLKKRRARNYSAGTARPDSVPGNMVYSIVPRSSGKVLVGTDCGIAEFDPETKKFVHMSSGPLSHAMIYDIKSMGDSKYWVATEFSGVFQLDLEQGFTPAAVSRPPELEYSRGIQPYSTATFHTMQTDSYGNVWLGHWGSGLVFVGSQQPLFSLIDADSGPDAVQQPVSTLTNRTVSSVAVDSEGRVWAGTDGGGINVFDGDRRVAVHRNLAGSERGNHIQAALCDSAANLWFGAFNGGLFFCDSATGRFSTVPLDSVVNEDVRAINEFDGHIFVAGASGIYELDRASHRLCRYHNVDMARDIVLDRDKHRWVGTFGSGLLMFDPDMTMIRMYNVGSGFPSNTINDLLVDRDGALWVATGEGLVHFDNPSDSIYTTYRHTDGLASSFVSAVTQDRDGNIWVSTNKGISILADGKISSYNHLDNAPLGSFMSSSVALDSLGRIYFGALNGLCRFCPRDVLAVRDAPAANITQFEVFSGGKVTDFATFGQMPAGERIVLDADQNTISITANIADHSLAQRVEYRFRLKGFDDDWFSTGSNTVVYRNLPHGSYTFEVNTRMRNQEWSSEITSVRITVEPPLPLTWWAKLLYFLLVVAVIWTLLHFYRRRLKAESLYQLEKKQRLQDKELADERLRFYTNVTHELRTPLTLIVGPLEDSLRGDGLSETERRRIGVVNRNARKLLSLVNQILDFRKSETANKRLCIMSGNIVSTVYETALKYKELISGSKIKINISADPESIVMPYDKEAVGMILDNLISNALKYTPKGTIDILCRKGADEGREYVEISVGDTGYGISADALPHIFDRYYQEKGSHQASGTGIGLALVKNLVELHHGSIKVDSKLNEGTVFTLRLWADESYPEAIHPDDTQASALPQLEPAGDTAVACGDDRRMPVVLVVEDNEDLREYISESFTDLFDVKTATNGQEGLEMARAVMPDIVLTDIMMPVMDGLEMTRQLKADIVTSHIPVIVLTAKDSDLDREDGYTAGADSYLTKPFSTQLLISRVNNILRSRELMANTAAPVMKLSAPQPPENNDEKAEAAPAEERPASEMSALDRDFLDRLHNAVSEHISSENVDVAFLSDTMCMSRATLYRKVKALTGLSPNEYIRKVRMQVAERLLAQGKFTISEVSFKVGINSTPYFRQCFKEEFGVNPSDYVRNFQG